MNQQQDETRGITLGAGERINHEQLQKNVHKASYLRMAFTIFVGCAAGILGFTGLAGVLVYGLAQLSVSGTVLLLCRSDTLSYFGQKPFVFVASSLGSELLSYILFWTLLYTLVRTKRHCPPCFVIIQYIDGLLLLCQVHIY